MPDAATAHPTPWPALAAAQAAVVPRVPFLIADGAHLRPAGSVARSHLGALNRWPDALQIDSRGVILTLPADERSRFFTVANATLHVQRLIVGWRHETYPVCALDDGRLLATLERAASRFWGTATLGAHCNGYVADAAGRPTHLWIARRSLSKATDPGLLDNLIGGGVPHGQTPHEAVLREGWEEAGLRPADMAGLQPGRRLRVARDVPEGFQLEWVSVFDLALPADRVPVNQDGEVQSLACLPVAQALAHAAAGEMTVDAALVTLDFALRHGLLPAAEQAPLAAALAPLCVGVAALAHPHTPPTAESR
jgi:8-oxo-dGTP pyrophosphatase MutT (NUDIX family)